MAQGSPNNPTGNGQTVFGNIHKSFDPGGFFGDYFGIDSAPNDSNPYAGMPGYPSYVGMDPNNPGFDLADKYGGPNAPLDKFSSESMRSGLSPSTQFALQQNTLGANAGRDQARKMASGMAKDQTAQLAMKGGLGAGASERIGKYSTNVGMEGANAADANAGTNRGNLLIQDEAARNGNMQAAAGLNMGQAQMKYNMSAGDMQRQQSELDRQNAYNMGGYQAQMGAWGAGKTADATQASADAQKKKGKIG